MDITLGNGHWVDQACNRPLFDSGHPMVVIQCTNDFAPYWMTNKERCMDTIAKVIEEGVIQFFMLNEHLYLSGVCLDYVLKIN
jgi:hypothetical protein